MPNTAALSLVASSQESLAAEPTSALIAAERAEELAALLKLLNSSSVRGMPTHTTIDSQTLDNMLRLAGRLSREVLVLLHGED
ncbi:hypothetical protein [Cupriavidus necator]|uniref:hypothetical protein n=1 Tax=Cupriavidus necator TaxID=106590 RepID=UPI00339D862C